MPTVRRPPERRVTCGSWHLETVDIPPPRFLRSRNPLADKESDIPHGNPQVNDRAAEESTRDEATAAVDGIVTDEGEDFLAVQAHRRGAKLEGSRSEVNHSIEGTADKNEVGMPNGEIKGSLNRAPRDRNLIAVAKEQNRDIVGDADQVQENIDEDKVGRGRLQT